MLTRTGLRPRETSGRGGHTNDSFANRSLAHVYLGGQHPFATAPTPSARRHLTPTRPPTTSGRSRRGQLRSPSLGRVRAGKVAQKPRSANALREKRNGSGGRTRGDGISGGRGRRSGRSCSPDLYRRASPKPAWDDSLRDLSQFRLTPEEMIRRKQSFVSRHNTLASERGGGDGGRREHPRTPTAKQAQPAAGKPRSHGRRHSGGIILTERFASQEELRAPVETSTISTEKGSVELAEASDVTAPLEPSQGGNGATEGCEERTKGAASDRAPGESDGLGKHHVGCSIGADEGHAGVFADDVVDSLGLAGIKEGIEAFTKRVCRLENDSKASFAAAMVGGEDEHAGETSREREPNLKMLRGGRQGCGGDDTTDLVKRIQLLEEHVLQLRPAAPTSLASSPEQAKKGKTENYDDAESAADDDEDSARGPRNARGRGKEKGAKMKESSIDDLRVVIAELLSLLALLLSRATNAEDRLRNFTTDEPDNATVESSEGTTLDGGGDDRRRLFSACSESIAWAGGGNTPAREKNEEVCSRPLSSSSQCDDAVEPSASGEAHSYAAREDNSREISPSPFPELRFGSGNVSREQIAHESTQPTKSTLLGSPVKDLWVEALDAVGQLVGGGDEEDEAPVVAVDLRSSTSSNRFRETERPARLTPPTTFAAPALTATGDTTSLAHSTDDSDAMEPRAAPRPLPRAAGVSSRRWKGAREVLAPIPMSALPSYHGNSTSSGHYARPSLFGDSGEEDAGLGPLGQMPIPTKKPQHPFERLPPMRPSWQRQDAGNAGWTHLPAPSLTVGDAYRRGADAFGDEDVGARGSAEPPAIGQWYTPTF